MKRTCKPVRNCHGCGLNFEDHCGIYETPHEMWHHRKCPGYLNRAMLAAYQDRISRQEGHLRKEKRRQAAKQRATEDHHQGTRQTAIAAKH